MKDQPYSEEGYELMGAAFEVQNEMGGGLREEIYQQSLEKELGLRNIPFVTKIEIDVFYKGQKLEAKYIPDLVVRRLYSSFPIGPKLIR